jgi:hypothetical protein
MGQHRTSEMVGQMGRLGRAEQEPSASSSRTAAGTPGVIAWGCRGAAPDDLAAHRQNERTNDHADR